MNTKEERFRVNLAAWLWSVYYQRLKYGATTQYIASIINKTPEEFDKLIRNFYTLSEVGMLCEAFDVDLTISVEPEANNKNTSPDQSISEDDTIKEVISRLTMCELKEPNLEPEDANYEYHQMRRQSLHIAIDSLKTISDNVE